MAARHEPSAGSKLEDVPNREEFSDFTIVFKNSQELKCHKIKLAEASPVFCRMMRKDCIETQTSKMQMTEFDHETVESFLDYIYQLALDQDIYKRKFDQKRLTAELLRFSHMYDVRSLLKKCTEHLLRNVDDTNVVEIWTVSEAIGHRELREVALQYIGEKKEKLLEVPGVEESFQSTQLVKSLVNYLILHPIEKEPINVIVKCYEKTREDNYLFSTTVQVRQSDTFKTLRFLTDGSIWGLTNSNWRCRSGSFRLHTNFILPLCFEEHQTLGFYGLENNITLRCAMI